MTGGSPVWRIVLLLAGLIVLACEGRVIDRPDQADAGGEATTAAHEPTSESDPCAGLDLPHVVGGAVGDLRLGLSLDRVRRNFPVVDTTIQAEGRPVPTLLVDLGDESVQVDETRGHVSRIVVTSPCFATRDSIRVGTPVSRFAAFPDVRASFHGVTVPSWCGLFFQVIGVQHRHTYYGPEEIAGMDEARVTGIVVTGGCPLPLIALRLGERSPGVGLRPFRHATTGDPVHLEAFSLLADPDLTAVDAGRTADGLLLSLTVTDEARARLQRRTAESVGRLAAVLVEGRVVGTATVASPIGAVAGPIQVGLELPPDHADELLERIAARWP